VNLKRYRAIFKRYGLESKKEAFSKSALYLDLKRTILAFLFINSRDTHKTNLPLHRQGKLYPC